MSCLFVLDGVAVVYINSANLCSAWVRLHVCTRFRPCDINIRTINSVPTRAYCSYYCIHTPYKRSACFHFEEASGLLKMQRTVALKFVVLASVIFLVLIAIIIVLLLVAVKRGHQNQPSSNSPRTTTSSVSCDFSMLAWSNYRLSNTTVPTLYKLTIHPFISAGTFQGSVSITLNVSVPTCFVYLHQNGLNITNSSVLDPSGNPLKLHGAFPYNSNEYWVLTLQNQISPGLFNNKLLDQLIKLVTITVSLDRKIIGNNHC